MTMTPSNADLAGRLEELSKKATPGPWERMLEGSRSEESTHYQVVGGASQVLFDSLNSTAACLEYEHDEDRTTYWDGVAEANFALITELVNNLPAIISALRSISSTSQVIAEGWRTIDSAPKDGTKVLGSCEANGINYVSVILWMKDSWRHALDGSTTHGFAPGLANRGATHWMPLPPPPQDRAMIKAAGGGG